MVNLVILFVINKSSAIFDRDMLPNPTQIGSLTLSNTNRKLDIVEDDGKDIFRAVSGRDMATQLSPERSTLISQ